jgi:hypothetical protein
MLRARASANKRRCRSICKGHHSVQHSAQNPQSSTVYITALCRADGVLKVSLLSVALQANRCSRRQPITTQQGLGCNTSRQAAALHPCCPCQRACAACANRMLCRTRPAGTSASSTDMRAKHICTLALHSLSMQSKLIGAKPPHLLLVCESLQVCLGLAAGELGRLCSSSNSSSSSSSAVLSAPAQLNSRLDAASIMLILF